MSLSMIALGDAGFAAYASLAEADAYLMGESRSKRTTWATAALDDKRRALVTATRLLDRLPWRGKPAVLSQATAWPRASVGVTTVPAGIEAAAILIAADLVKHPGGADGEPAATVREEQIGPKRVAYFHHSPDAVEHTIGPVLDALVRPFIAEWLALAPTSPYAVADAS